MLRAEGLRYREIGEVLGIATSTVADHVDRAVRKLAEKCKCEFSSKLIPWLDDELPPLETEALDRHVAECGECREQAQSFRNVSKAFAVYIRETAALPVHSNRRWFLIPAAIAAAVLAAFLLTPRRISHVHTDIQQRATTETRATPQNAAVTAAKAMRPHMHRRIQSNPRHGHPWSRPSRY